MALVEGGGGGPAQRSSSASASASATVARRSTTRSPCSTSAIGMHRTVPARRLCGVTVKMFLHGVPETTTIWRDLVAGLDGDVRLLALPGFGTPVPAGFDCSMDSYLAWLHAEIADAGAPVDLVGHDWGGILTAKVAADGPDNLRSWVTDAPGALRPGFVWHDTAQIWRTPGTGEEFFAGLMADRAASTELMTALGLSPEHAAMIVDGVDQTMADSILALYRSSDGLGSDWLIDGPPDHPGLIIASADDPFISVRTNHELAELMEVDLVLLESGGHFWPIEAPEAARAAITRFWDSLG